MSFVKKIMPKLLLSWYHQFWPFWGALIYRFPGKNKNTKIIGITGTNGKTTVTHLATAILEAAGYKVASISSLRFKIGDKEWKNELKMTMPGRLILQKFLRQAVDARCQYAVMEVTSEGIKQYRHKFIDFDVAVFTNLTPEHIESHGGFENYKKAKGELFKIAKACVINIDNSNAGYFSNLCRGKKYNYSAHDNEIGIVSPMPGEFNLANALAAAYVGISQGVDLGVIKRTIENFKGVPGRMEIVVKKPFTVIVDYAHTPDALEKVYKTILNLKSRSVTHPPSPLSYPKRGGAHEDVLSMICVLGSAGGGRDKWKRPQMGRIAAHYCNEVILTNEDPYDEDPEKIISQVEAGVRSENPCDICVGPGGKSVKEHREFEVIRILDRREAIKKALQRAKPNDVVIITGKGAEPLLMTRMGPIAWDDRQIVKEELAKLL
jgi:UDP-N-acetylmuramoyl-L-alanyl-D-glutamate--2,6-diaminopimelate ligase